MFYLYVLGSANWTQCAVDAMHRVDTHSETDSDRLSELNDSDSDCGGGGGEASLPVPEVFSLAEGDSGGGGGKAGGGGGHAVKVTTAGGGGVVMHEKSRLLTPV